MQKSSSAPLPCSSSPNRTRHAGLRFGLARLRGLVPFDASLTVVGSKFALLRRFFIQKSSSARFLAPPLQIEPAMLGFDLGWLGSGGVHRLTHHLPLSGQSSLCSGIFYPKIVIRSASLLLLSKSQPLRWVAIWAGSAMTVCINALPPLDFRPEVSFFISRFSFHSPHTVV